MIKYLIYDTETDGLNIVESKPFLHQYGLVDEKLNLVSVHSFYDTDVNAKAIFLDYLKQVPTIVGANIKFDIHMGINSGIPMDLFTDKNYIDVQWLARLVIDHDLQVDASFSISLKKLALRYLGIDSADEERQLKMELSQLTSAHKQKMLDHLINTGVLKVAPTKTAQTKVINEIYSSWTKSYHKYGKDVWRERKLFLKTTPPPTYQDCSNVVNYGETDIKLTHGLFKLWYKEVVNKKQTDTFMRLNKATIPLMLMERKGLSVDIKRVLKDRNLLLKEQAKTKIIDPRTMDELSVGQHAKLKELYEYESGLQLSSSDKEARKLVFANSPAAQAAEYLSKIAKYLNTYVTGILNKLTLIDGEYKVYTQYNMAGTVTGRLSSDFQQYPKEPLELNDGSVIDIRGWFLVPKQDKYMVYFDYSQLELRLQCEWTNIVNGQPDLNMVRAFEPYNTHIDPLDGKIYLDENPTTEWKPTDLHGLTAKTAFPGIDESHPDWGHYRQLGKRANFAINYGAAAPKLVEALNVDFPTAQALVAGYRQAFAGVVLFGKWLQRKTYSVDNIPNLFLRRYYSRNKHSLNNWLIQGSGADLLLLKLREVYEYLKDKPHWSFMITVHDEVGFTCTDIPDAQLDKEIKEIRQIMLHQFSAVEATVDVEYTATCWSEKQDYHC